GGTATATITIVVAPVNDEPLAQDDNAFTDEDAAVTITVLANDSDPEGNELVIQAVSSPTHGTAEIQGATVVYTPSAGFSGIDGFTYVAVDGDGGSAEALVTVNVATVNHAPAAAGGHVETDEDVAITIAVLESDIDPDGDALTLQSVTQPEHGTLTKSGTTATYVPDSGFHGDDAFTYMISDGRGGTSSATITITVVDVNDSPLARDDSASTNEDVGVTISVLANDSDPDGDLLAVEAVTSPAHGDVEISGSAIRYVPALDFHGVDSFTYVVVDGHGGSSSASVTIDVASVNDLPVAEDDEVSTLEDMPATISVLANDADPDGDSLTIESTSTPHHGVVIRAGTSIVYTPAANYSGEDTFTYTVKDGNGGTDTATVTVTVIAVNDLPIAQDDTATTSAGTALTVEVLSNDRDPDGDALAVQSVNQPSHGTVANGGSELTYVPQAGFSGTDAFSYTVSDGQGGSATALVSITVTPVNHAPTAQDDSASMSGESILMIEILGNDRDPDGDFLLVQSIGSPAHGTVLNGRTAISYIPDARFSGVDTFSYIVSDGNGGSATAVVTVSVAAANQAPVASDDTGVTDEDVPVTISVLSNDLDPDGDALHVESISQPSAGSVTRDGTSITYTPAAERSEVDSFTYTVSDGRGGTATATVLVVVVAVNDPPTAQDDSATTDMEVAISISVLTNDTDPEGGVLAVVSVSSGQNGTVFNEGASILYTPDPGFVGTDTLTYTVRDSEGLTATATVTVGVAGVTGGGGASEGTALDGRVVINEVAWAGTAADAQDEWIELRNLGAEPIDLEGWSLQWRRTRPVAPEDYTWKTIKLSGVLAAASATVYNSGDDTAGISVWAEDSSNAAWRVLYDPDRDTRGYFLLERTRDEAVSDVSSSMLYDATRSPALALSDLGEVILLVNARGEIVDTANASNAGRDEWAAGSKTTFGSMERIDPFGADVRENWSTNAGVITRGVDARKRPLYGTPGTRNAPRLETLYERAGTHLTLLRAGGPLEVSFGLSRAERKTTGWPWIVTTRPGLDLAAGAGGSLDLSACSFSGRAKSGDEYILDIGTSGAAPGVFVFWIVYGKGEALLVPVRITP
ncbi:MAG: Ig-like domain-containing protein, partial [Candidatus Bipolaricaulota bacterium]|nr:Ig-like domain-containing protein [Candidatus Bipolaricaulota bacterium]